jgi:hypothetical protein
MALAMAVKLNTPMLCFVCEGILPTTLQGICKGCFDVMADDMIDVYHRAPKAWKRHYEQGIQDVFRRGHTQMLWEETVVADAANATFTQEKKKQMHKQEKTDTPRPQSDTVTDFARFRGWSIP